MVALVHVVELTAASAVGAMVIAAVIPEWSLVVVVIPSSLEVLLHVIVH